MYSIADSRGTGQVFAGFKAEIRKGGGQYSDLGPPCAFFQTPSLNQGLSLDQGRSPYCLLDKNQSNSGHVVSVKLQGATTEGVGGGMRVKGRRKGRLVFVFEQCRE